MSARSKARKRALDVLYEADIRGTVPADVLAATATHLFYGSYHDSNALGAHVYRSADRGEHWEEVLSVPEPLARHVHSVAGP